MKTPRELLFQRHRSADSKLDAVRGKLVTDLGRRGSNRAVNSGAGVEPGPPARDWLSVAWRELFWNSRRVWAGFAVVWAALLVCNFALADRSTSPGAAVIARLPAAEMARLWEAQTRLRTELLGEVEPAAGNPTQPTPGLRPRSARRPEEAMG